MKLWHVLVRTLKEQPRANFLRIDIPQFTASVAQRRLILPSAPPK